MMEGSASVNVIQPLIDLQDTDGQIRELEREARDIPQRKAQEIARLNGVNAALEIAKNQLVAMQQRIKNEEAEAEEIRTRVRDLKTAQLNIKSNKEMQQSIMQIEGLERDAEAAENRALALTEDEIPVLEKRVADAQSKVDADKGGVDGYVAELDVRLAEVKSELDELMKERAAKADAVSRSNPKFLLYYERQRTKRWPVVVTLNHDGVCDGCHMKQPPFVEQLVQHNKDLVACTMCGRILYRDL